MIDQTMNDIFSQTPVNNQNVEQIVPINQLINENQTVTQQVEPAQVAVQTPVQKKKMDKILMIQILLLVIWAVLATLVYFFGYDLFEPFIKV